MRLILTPVPAETVLTQADKMKCNLFIENFDEINLRHFEALIDILKDPFDAITEEEVCEALGVEPQDEKLKRKIENLQSELSAMEKEKDEYEESNRRLTSDVRDLEEENHELRQEVKELEARLEQSPPQ